MNTRSMSIVVRFELSRLVRSPQGILFLIFFLCYYGWLALWLRETSHEIAAAGAQLTHGQGGAIVQGIVSWWTDLEAQAVTRLLTDHPPILVVAFVLALLATPILAMLASFDQTASDIHSRNVRFLLLRTDRTSLYLAKAAGSFVYFAVCQAIGIALVGLTLSVTGDGIGAAGWFYLGRVALTLMGFAVPFVALMALAGAVTGHAFLALLLGTGLQGAVWAVASIGGIMDENIRAVRYAFPTAMKYHLVSDVWSDIAMAAAHQLAFGAVVFALGLAIFRRRDV